MMHASRVGKLGREWDSFDAYLFDVDGTLIECKDATHYFAFLHTLEAISGQQITLEGVTAHGNTDIGILRDALAVGSHRGNWRSKLPEIRDRLAGFVEERSEEICATVLAGVVEILDQLRARGAKLGIATGNLERIGKTKLRRAGLLDRFDFGAWSDDCEYRKDVFNLGINRATELCGKGAALCVVGDTPADIEAAHHHALPIISVATGIYSFEELQQHNPELGLRSFLDLLD